VAQNEKIPMLTTSFSRGVLKENPYSYKINFDALKGCEQMIAHVKENGGYNKLGVLMSRVGYNEDCIKGVKEVDPNIFEVWYDFGQKDFRTELLKLKNAGVDGIITVGIDFEYVAMFNQIAELGYKTNFFCATASECIFNNDLINAAQEMEGDIYGIDFFDPNKIPESEFADKYSKKYEKAEGIVLTYSAIGYDQTYMLKEILEKCEPRDHECINMEMNNYKGSGGKITNANGFEDRVLNYNYQIYKFDNEWILQ
jgi:ABC-type branched-subunit amino acid transport system substrate-binding protein